MSKIYMKNYISESTVAFTCKSTATSATDIPALIVTKPANATYADIFIDILHYTSAGYHEKIYYPKISASSINYLYLNHDNIYYYHTLSNDIIKVLALKINFGTNSASNVSIYGWTSGNNDSTSSPFYKGNPNTLINATISFIFY